MVARSNNHHGKSLDQIPFYNIFVGMKAIDRYSRVIYEVVLLHKESQSFVLARVDGNYAFRGAQCDLPRIYSYRSAWDVTQMQRLHFKEDWAK